MRFIEKISDRRVKIIKSIPYYLRKFSLYIIEYCDTREQIIISQDDLEQYFIEDRVQFTTEEKIKLYTSLFRGRKDVYAKSYINKTGKIQYFPSYNYGWRQLPASKRTYQPFTIQVLKSHLRGETSIGIFPISKEDTCWFLAIDLDNDDFQEAALVIVNIAEQYGIFPSIELSRSGNGAHIWFFFDEEINCRNAREFGKKLLEIALQSSDKITFSSFDRLFPNQDFLPKGGFGNLIALPLQGQRYEEGRTVFVDKNFYPFSNQWEYLSHIQKLSYQDLKKFLNIELVQEELQGSIRVRLSNHLIFDKNDLNPKTKFYLQKLASFSNPEFYLKQAMRQPTFQVSERLYLFEESSTDLKIPRGLLSELIDTFDIEIHDERLERDDIKVTFKGELTFEQELALSDMLQKENGVLQAETGFGKTVLAAALIGQMKKRTVVLVHNTQLFEQWLERLKTFMSFDEPKAVRYTSSGREKVIGHIGQFGANKRWRSKLVDVIMIQSLFKIDNPNEILNDYDMMIVDECHHVSSIQFEKVISCFSGKYLYGLTATPERKNGHEPIVFQRIGPILHRANNREVDFSKYLNLNFTSFGKFTPSIQLSTNFTELNEQLAHDRIRNEQIITDVLKEYSNRKHILVIVNRIEHIENLYRMLEEKEVENLWTIHGKMKRKERQKVLLKIDALKNNMSFVLISTGKYIGEGFDLPQLDTLVLAGPLSWKNNLIQYAGRIHRLYENKTSVQIFDYVDMYVPYLEKMFHKRQIAYKKMNYKIGEKNNIQTVFDRQSYRKHFDRDVEKGNNILLRTKFVDIQLVRKLLKVTAKGSLKLVLPKSNRLVPWLKSLSVSSFKLIITDVTIFDTIVIINNSVVWYGNFSLGLKQQIEDTCILRLESDHLAKEFLNRILE